MKQATRKIIIVLPLVLPLFILISLLFGFATIEGNTENLYLIAGVLALLVYACSKISMGLDMLLPNTPPLASHGNKR